MLNLLKYRKRCVKARHNLCQHTVSPALTPFECEIVVRWFRLKVLILVEAYWRDYQKMEAVYLFQHLPNFPACTVTSMRLVQLKGKKRILSLPGNEFGRFYKICPKEPASSTHWAIAEVTYFLYVSASLFRPINKIFLHINRSKRTKGSYRTHSGIYIINYKPFITTVAGGGTNQITLHATIAANYFGTPLSFCFPP